MEEKIQESCATTVSGTLTQQLVVAEQTVCQLDVVMV